MKKIFTLMVLVLAGAFSASAQDVLIDFPTATDGTAAAGSTSATTVKIHMNKDAVSCYKLANGYTSSGVYNGNSIDLTTEGGFKKGDVVTVAGAVNVDMTKEENANKRSTAVLFVKDADGKCTALKKFADFINGRDTEGDPVEESFTLEEDAEALFLGRDGNTAANVTLIKVVRGGGDEPADGVVLENIAALKSYLPGEDDPIEGVEVKVKLNDAKVTYVNEAADAMIMEDASAGYKLPYVAGLAAGQTLNGYLALKVAELWGQPMISVCDNTPASVEALTKVDGEVEPLKVDDSNVDAYANNFDWRLAEFEGAVYNTIDGQPTLTLQQMGIDVPIQDLFYIIEEAPAEGAKLTATGYIYQVDYSLYGLGILTIFQPLSLVPEEVDSINKVDAAAVHADAIYDLTGRRLMSMPQKGVIIINGRKVMK